MRSLRTWQLLVSLTVFGFTGVASATNFSFTGNFSTDDQLDIINFTIGAPSNITALTLSYGGGTNQAGTAIAAGGFDPWLAIFDSAGNLLSSVDNGSCPPLNADQGNCFDSQIDLTLGIGSYLLVLSQSDNAPVGTTLADGYTRTGQPNFTAAFGCSNGQFCDASTLNRSPNWAVDLLNVAAVGNTGVPEPSTLLLLAGGLAGISLLRRRFLKL